MHSTLSCCLASGRQALQLSALSACAPSLHLTRSLRHFATSSHPSTAVSSSAPHSRFASSSSSSSSHPPCAPSCPAVTSASSSVPEIDYLQKILTATVYDCAIDTPLQPADVLSAQLGNKVLLKREDLQPVFSFKLRGAYNKISQLSEKEKKAGIICSSAGNHAQGVAYSARRLGIDAKIVMPAPTPDIKVNAVRRFGGQVVLHGDSFDECSAEARKISQKEGRTFIHPFDDPLVIAGQGTIGMEIIRATMNHALDAIFIPVGGGGMIGGIGAYVKRIRPDVKIIGVEATDAAGMTASLKQGKIVTLDSVGLFADGCAVKTVGTETFRLAQKYVDDMVTVSTDEICAAIEDGFVATRGIVEPAGALSVAGIKKYVRESRVKGRTFAAVLSGANMNFSRLRFVAERCEPNEALIAAVIPEKPGSFLQFYSHIFPRDVTEFSYRYSDKNNAHIIMSFRSKSKDETVQVVSKLRGAGVDAIDITDNELAKMHLRYMAGGRAPEVTSEVLYRFGFPETPGALLRFLVSLQGKWNVSLFHYRNFGADIGQVLVGVQVPEGERGEFQKFLGALGYDYIDETKNECYKRFLV